MLLVAYHCLTVYAGMRSFVRICSHCCVILRTTAMTTSSCNQSLCELVGVVVGCDVVSVWVQILRCVKCRCMSVRWNLMSFHLRKLKGLRSTLVHIPSWWKEHGILAIPKSPTTCLPLL